MMKIITIKQYCDIPDNDFVLLLRKPHSKDKLHKPTCKSFKIRDILLKNEGVEIDPDFVKISFKNGYMPVNLHTSTK